MTSFEDLGISARLIGAMNDMGWTEPTPVQCEAVPAGIAGSDLVVKAQTGTGKTGAYAMIVMSRTGKGRESPSALVITPTRELAMQVDTELRKLSRGTGHVSIAVYGGAPIDRQISSLRRGADIVVGTPGRLRDLLERDVLDLSSVSELVLDEADRMLDMGFEEDLEFITEHIPQERHSLMFSATIDGEVRDLAEGMLNDPVVIDISGDEPTTGLTRQYMVSCKRNEKKEVLYDILFKGTPKTIVFFSTKSMVDTVYQELKGEGAKVGTLHGDMPQKLRERVIGDFRDNRILILLATDVAARGLDVSDVDLVVNFDLPLEPETYLHRIGRTGRAGKEGVSISLVNPRDRKLVRMCEDEADAVMEKITVEELQPIDAVHEPVARERRRKEEAKVVKNRNDNRRERKSSEREGFATLEINLGRADGLTRSDIADMIRKRADLPDDAVGKVGLKDDVSFVEVSLDHSDFVLENLDGSDLDGKKITVVPAPAKERHHEPDDAGTYDRRRENRYKNYMKKTEADAAVGNVSSEDEDVLHSEPSDRPDRRRYPDASDHREGPRHNGYGGRDGRQGHGRSDRYGDRAYVRGDRGRNGGGRYESRPRDGDGQEHRNGGRGGYGGGSRSDRGGRPYGGSGYGGRERSGGRSHGRPYEGDHRDLGRRSDAEGHYGDRSDRRSGYDDYRRSERTNGRRPSEDRGRSGGRSSQYDNERSEGRGHSDRGSGRETSRRYPSNRDSPKRYPSNRDSPKRYPSNRDSPKRYPSNRDIPKKKYRNH